MKKILIGFALSMTTLSFAQQYPNSGYGYGDDDGYSQNDGGYYSDQDDQNYFPDDYYYNYPQDYYPQDYYQTNYNDYRNSIISINWNGFFAQNRLSPWQVDQILRLNNLYVSFSTWNNFYRYNPDRWYYDRFYALQRIMGPRVFVTFQNNYYRGYSPVVYFQNYRRTHYAAICRPMPRYRNVNINIYRVDRAKFRRYDNPTINIVRGSDRPNNGFRGGVKDGNGGFRNQAGGRNSNPVFRNDNGVRNNGGYRGNTDNGGIRNGGGFRNERSERAENNGNGGGFRGGDVRREEPPRRENNGGGFRGDGGLRRNENSAPRPQNNGGGERRGNGGFRNGFAKN